MGVPLFRRRTAARRCGCEVFALANDGPVIEYRDHHPNDKLIMQVA